MRARGAGALVAAVAAALTLTGVPAGADPADAPPPRVTQDADGTVRYVDPALDDEDVTRLRGTLRVVVVDGTGDGAVEARRDVALERPDGTVVPLDLAVAAAETVAPDAEVVADLVDGPDLDAALAGRSAERVAVESAVVEPPVAAGTSATPRAHRAYVAVATGTGAASAATIGSRVDRGLAWWVAESDGAISTFTRPSGTPTTFASGLSDPCGFTDPDEMWDRAARRFPGVSFDPSSGNHLVVVVGEACHRKGTGVGTLAAPSLAAGGMILMVDRADIFTSTLVHELGHNVGLEHANLSTCDTCTPVEYWDLYSPMALAIGGGSYGPPALDGEFRQQLGLTTSAEVATVTGTGAVQHTLRARGSGSGLRSLRVVAADGTVHWVEARLAGGRDAGSFVAASPDYVWKEHSPDRAYPTGVTISTHRRARAGAPETPSLLRGLPVGGTVRGARTTGQSFTDGAVTVTVDAVTATSATVTVTIGQVVPKTMTTGVPRISGTAKVGSTLKRTTGTWTSGASLATQWLVDGVVVPGATGASFKPAAAQVGRRVTVRVTGTRAGYATASRTSATTKAVAAGSLKVGKVSVSGTRKVGRTLTAKRGTWTSGTSFAYQWYAGSSAIKGASSWTFKPTKAQRGKKLRVRVTGSKAGYTTVRRYSAYTGKIAR